LIGGLGEDFLHGGLGADVLKGGAGNDTYILDGANVIDEEASNDSGDRVLSSVSVDLSTLARGKIEHATLLGTAALDATGNTADNELIGNDGANILSGGDGADTLCGGAGIDTLTGGQGSDTFDFNLLSEAGDIITDFITGVGGDVLDLSDLLDSFGYGGPDPFADGFLSFVQSSGNTIVQVDSDGSGIGGITNLATLSGVTLTAADTGNYLV
jgi:Ca2+-binding RTX toxin-like protein